MKTAPETELAPYATQEALPEWKRCALAYAEAIGRYQGENPQLSLRVREFLLYLVVME